ncbi:unnamed protein product [Sphenostylis stenocarpa]|uniref:Uncharacterized protein n=1 Tax=Sphenostylis stenocarpa TaxID=92480 RepID=A0AA86T9Y3_9FABA|nr:unnamed protein product [Sphenostylis stenocarpa]
MKFVSVAVRSLSTNLSHQFYHTHMIRSLSTWRFTDNGTGDQHANKSASPEEFGKFGENRARYAQFDSVLEKINQQGMARQRPGSGNGASSEMMHLFEESHDTLLDGMDVKLKNAATYFEVDEEEINKEDYAFRYDANFPIDSKYDVKTGTEEQSPCSCCATTVRRRRCCVLLPRHHLFQQSSLTFPNLEPFDLEYQSSHFSGKTHMIRSLSTWRFTDNGTGEQHANKSESPEEFGKFGENRARYAQFDSFLEKINQQGMTRQRPGSGNGASSEMMHLFEESHDTLLDGMDVKLKNAATYFEVDEEEINKEDYAFRYDANFPIDSKYDVKALDLTKPGVHKPHARNEFIVTTKEVLSQADFRVSIYVK